MSQTQKKVVALSLLMGQACLAAIVVATPRSLGLSDVAVAWLSIANVGVGVWLNGLPTIWSSEA